MTDAPIASGPYDVALLTPDEMASADRLTIAGGISGRTLMGAAGRAVAEVAQAMLGGPGGGGNGVRVACLAGPGNNGGDAFVAAETLRCEGVDVVVFSVCDIDRLAGDAAWAAAAYRGSVEPLGAFTGDGCALVIDGLFGAGLSRPLDAEIANLIETVERAGVPVLAIDLPSGLCGRSGAVLGKAFTADRTVTFFRPKPGHFLEPGRSHCGVLDVRQIGIAPDVLETIAPRQFVNRPALWRADLSLPVDAGHKYDRGHAVVFSGSASRTGAARLAAGAALRAGAGLVTLFSPAGAILVNAAQVTAVMVERCDGERDLARHLDDSRLKAFVLGPGFGVGGTARAYATQILKAGRFLILDADGISSFADRPEELFDEALGQAGEGGPNLVLTPHAGEFKRLFPDLAAKGSLSKLDRTREAAVRSGAVVVLKGRDTVIAAPDGRAAINANGTPWLASAGTGDVLTGMICAQLSQGTPTFEAACAGVWMHGRSAELFGPGLIAEDLAGQLPAMFAELLA
ncbi:NAD(P)H-hydrate dehydratase [Fulvimarina sp. 2208YS6-2-32]|uniref:Bifunctional NAD(P)H-hydrate repair enzyme n=1 Tax=Fulvimarina uroteuthidis TaxID=3098149 RepID=A0ABU5I4R8_9HYPH|nr:NAD(P)H-hydrate dehydratase [Fulvimarina sp. 2208YS6-2-32]MDY8110375.1 NAD(P)H-hydrate dehydratase [Fulvimarina sp. 2208YS6-2-32]